MNLIDEQKERDKQEEVKSLNKRYAKRRGFRELVKKAERMIFKDDILQPYQPQFKQRWYKAWKDRQLMYDAVDRKVKRDEKELEELYRKRLSKNVITREGRILRDIHTEHPKMMSESDIIKHSVND